MKQPKYSVGRSPRFDLLGRSELNLNRNLPLTYAENIIQRIKDNYSQVSQGYGKKYTYKTSKEEENGPGPIYKTDYTLSIK